MEEATKSIMTVATMEKEESFKLERERDILSKGLGNPEYLDRVRGISLRLGRKEVFLECVHMYRKQDRYKEKMQDYLGRRIGRSSRK